MTLEASLKKAKGKLGDLQSLKDQVLCFFLLSTILQSKLMKQISALETENGSLQDRIIGLRVDEEGRQESSRLKEKLQKVEEELMKERRTISEKDHTISTLR